jgi:hypothetical protein
MTDTTASNNMTTTPGFAIKAGGSALAKIATTAFFKVNTRSMYVTAQDAPSLALAGLMQPIVGNVGAGSLPVVTGNQLTYGGSPLTVVSSLAFDNGSQPASTNSCQIFTLCANSVETEAGTVSLYWLAGAPFPKHRQSQESDIAHTPLATSVEVGYLYIKNEGAVAFVPGTTALDATNVTTVFTNNFGQEGK